MQRRSTKRKYSGADPSSWKKLKYNPKSATASLTRKVNKILSEQERKNLDLGATVTPAVNTAAIIQLNSIPQGDDAVSRDGRKVSMVSSQMRYTVKNTAATFPTLFRVMVLRDNQSNGITPVIADILAAPTNIRSPLTLDFKERFRVIHDNYCTFGKGDYNQDVSASAENYQPGQYFFKFKDMDSQVEYGTIGNIPTSNSLIMVFLFETGFTGSMSYYHRLRFTDS